MVVNRVNECVNETWANKARDKVQKIIDSLFSDFNFKYQIEKRIQQIIEDVCGDDTHREIVKIVRKHVRPQIIYIHEPKGIPPQLASFGVTECFVPPSGPCIYFLCRGDEVVYIGQSINLSSRLGQHLDMKHFDRVFYVSVPREDLTWRELELINQYQPELNKQGKGPSQ